MEDINTSAFSGSDQPGRFHYFPFYNTKQASFFLALIAVLFTCTSINNEYALDDSITIHQNDYVLKGIRGMGDILTHDAYDSFYKRMCAKDQLQGGRYRPLPILTFAFEQELIGRYRSGKYMMVSDLNHNGRLDYSPVEATNACGTDTETTYEYNDFEDVNQDGQASPDECVTCWDLNRNFKNDFNEDLNQDGVYNEIDCQVNKAWIRHFNNIWLYALLCMVLYTLLNRYIIRNNQDLAFLSALVFAAHPIHSEIVANVIGRESILSLLFICLTLLSAFNYMQSKQSSHLFWTCLCCLLAMLSKEYGLLLLLIVPLSLYVFGEDSFSLKRSLVPFLLFAAFAVGMIYLDIEELSFGLHPLLLYSFLALVFVSLVQLYIKFYPQEQPANKLMNGLFTVSLVYLVLRLNAVNTAPGVEDTEILNNPYLFASPADAFATKVYVLIYYLKLLVFPHPLCSDYSFATFNYQTPASIGFWLSLLVHLGLFVAGVVLSRRKRLLGYALLWYLLFILVPSNLFFSTGTVLLEGHIFHSSVGFAIVVSIGILKIVDLGKASMAVKRAVLFAALLLVLSLFGAKMWERNWDWKNDVSLFLKDVKNNSNSVLILGNAGARWIDLADTREITGFYEPGSDSTRYNDYNGTLKITDEEVKAGGYKNKREAALNYGIGYLEKAVTLHSKYVNGYLNLGLAHYKLGHDDKVIFYWKMAEHLYPNNPYLSNYYEVYKNLLQQRAVKAAVDGRYDAAIQDYTRLRIVDPKYYDAWKGLKEIYEVKGDVKKMRQCEKQMLLLSPSVPTEPSQAPFPEDSLLTKKNKNPC